MILILNFAATEYTQGGNAREYALHAWATAMGAETWLVQDDRWRRGRVFRLFALPLLLLRLWRAPRAIVVLNHPGFPFFWSLDSAPQLLRSLAFAFGCKIVSVLRGQSVVIDIRDLPRYQHVDLEYEVGLPRWLLSLFDWAVYHLSSELWVCSAAIADVIKREMIWGASRVKVVVNGAFPSDYDCPSEEDGAHPIRLIYAGLLMRSRIEPLIGQFCASRRNDMELRLCGIGGDWIPESVSDPRIRYLGALSEDECAKAVAESDVGIVYQLRGPYYDIVYPTKLPLYLARGKPVIATDNPELERAVTEAGVGIVVPPDALTPVLDSLDRRQLGDYSRNAAEMRSTVYWNWIYDRACESILNRRDRGSRGG